MKHSGIGRGEIISIVKRANRIMGILEAVFLGILQGVTEFLPVSSSGHLVLFQNIFETPGDMLFFDTMLHVGTLVAVFIVLWKDIAEILRHLFARFTWVLVVATIPAVVAGVLLGDFFEGAFEGTYLAFGFLITSLLLVLSEQIAARRKAKYNSKEQIGFGTALGVGCMQAVAILPGISRSGSTLSGSLMAGLDRSLAASFSFLMSIPVILGSAGEIYLVPTILGMAAAAVSSFFAAKYMMKMIRNKKLYGFAVYTAVLGVLVLLDQLFFHVVFANPFIG